MMVDIKSFVNNSNIKIKICGTTNLNDALFAANNGADYLGFIFYKKSPRYVEPKQAADIIKKLPATVKSVGVFVNSTLSEIDSISTECNLDYVQLSGNESSDFAKQIKLPVIKAFHIKEKDSLPFRVGMGSSNIFAYLLDTHIEGFYGGTGQTFNLDILKNQEFDKPIFLAGGLTSQNINEVLSKVKPYAVDVCSGVEKSPGRKDLEKLKRFIEIAKPS